MSHFIFEYRIEVPGTLIATIRQTRLENRRKRSNNMMNGHAPETKTDHEVYAIQTTETENCKKVVVVRSQSNEMPNPHWFSNAGTSQHWQPLLAQ